MLNKLAILAVITRGWGPVLGVVCALVGGMSQAFAQRAPVAEAGQRALTYNELWVGRSYEEGVANRILIDYRGVHRIADVSILTGASYSLLQQTGLSLLGLGAEYHIDPIWCDVGLGLTHESWSDWGASENRLLGYVTFAPFRVLALTVGLAWRTVQYNGLDIRHAAAFPTANAEVNVMYRGWWEFLRLRNVTMAFGVWNYDRMRLYTPDNIHLSMDIDVRVAENWLVMGMVAVGISGVSGAILSWSQNSASLGVAYELF